MHQAAASNAPHTSGRSRTIADPREVIAGWLAEQRILGEPGNRSGAHARRFGGNARIAPDAIGVSSRFVPRQSGGSTHAAAGTPGHALLFDPAPTAFQRSPLSIDLPTNTTRRNRIAEDHGKQLAGGQISDLGTDLPEPGRMTPSFVGSPNYWAPGPIPPADTGTRWGNSIANAFISPANTLINPIVETGAAVAPYSPALDAIEMSMSGLPGYGKLAAIPIAGASAWSRAAIRAARRLDKQGEELAKLAGRHRVRLHSPSQRMEVDLAGRAHGGIPTPHTKISPANPSTPKELGPKYNSSKKNATIRPSTQEDIRTTRRFLERRP